MFRTHGNKPYPEEVMRQRRAGKLPVLLVALMSAWAYGSQIQAFKNSPARAATAAQQVAQEQQSEVRPAAEAPEGRTEKALNEARGNDGALYAFLKEMPKGGDLHNHITGAVYAESLVRFAADSGLCIDRQSLALAPAPCTPGQAAARQALSDPELYRNAIDAWSMRDLQPGPNGHDHFFDTFSKFGPATEAHLAQILAEVTQRAADGNVQYMELMVSPDHGRASALGERFDYDPDFAKMRQTLLAADFASMVDEARKNLDTMEQGRNEQLHCGTEPEIHGGGCSVHVRYIYQVARAAKPAQVFAQILMGFELASRDPRVVALNLVQPEDWYVPMRDFHLHMQMVNYLKSLYPEVHLTLHAGELKPGMVPPDGLRFHIRESVEVGKAERIGHGVDVMYEDHPRELLAMMARHNVMVEICLTSNQGILGVQGRQHPLAMYLKAGVPVALATDDEGVSRSEMTLEYERAVLDQGLDYITLKKMARTSLEHAFLPGVSLWSDAHRSIPVRECAGEKPTAVPGQACMKFLNANEKAREQWRLERRFADFESTF
jgi:adenosine deaminase